MKRTIYHFSRRIFTLAVVVAALLGIRPAAQAQIINRIAGIGTYGFSGDGGPAVLAEFFNTRGVAVDPNTGFVYISDYGNYCIRQVDNLGIITTIAGTPGVWGYTGDGGAATSATMNLPWGLAVDQYSNLYISDPGNNVVRKVDLTTGIITTVAGNGTSGFGGDGGPATSAKLAQPLDVAVDNSGNLFIADVSNEVIRIVDGSGIINTYAGTPGSPGFSGDGGAATGAQLYSPMGVGTDPAGNLYIADATNNRIRMVDLTGNINTIAGSGGVGFAGDGGPATLADFQYPQDVAADGAGNVYIGDMGNYRIRKVDAGGTITTFAGNGTQGYTGDGGLATLAELWEPEMLWVDPAGCLYYTGKYENRVRKICPGHSCYDDARLNITSTTDRDGNCIFTATATVATANMIVGYSWAGAGPTVIHHTGAPSDVFTFILPPGGSATISVTVFMVDPDFTDPEAGPCCQAYLRQDVNCEGHPRGRTTPGAPIQSPATDELSIYPNPTNDAVNIVGGKQTITSVQVIDVNGKKIGDYTYDKAKQVNISLSKFPPGTYLMRVNNGASKVVTKLK